MTIAIAAVRVTPIAISDPPLLNAAGVHEPFGLRSIIEVEGANGHVGLGETYGDAPVLALLQKQQGGMSGLDCGASLKWKESMDWLAWVKPTVMHLCSTC